MFPGINPKQMQAMMKQMGIANQEIPTSKVIIEKEDGNKIIINNPSVTRIKMSGQESFQITGDVSEQETYETENESFSEEDIQTIVQKTNCTEKQAKEALEETGDLAEAILKLS